MGSDNDDHNIDGHINDDNDDHHIDDHINDDNEDNDSDQAIDVDKVSNIEINVQPASSLIRLPTENILNQEPSNTLIEDSLQMLDKLEANQESQCCFKFHQN